MKIEKVIKGEGWVILTVRKMSLPGTRELLQHQLDFVRQNNYLFVVVPHMYNNSQNYLIVPSNYDGKVIRVIDTVDLLMDEISRDEESLVFFYDELRGMIHY